MFLAVALSAARHVRDRDKLVARFRELIEWRGERSTPSQERLYGVMRRTDILRELATWDVDHVRTLAPAIAALLRDRPHHRDAAELLKKLGYTIRGQRGRFETVAEPK